MRKYQPVIIISIALLTTSTTAHADGWQFWKNSKKTAAQAKKDPKADILKKDIATSARVKMAELNKYDPKEEANLLKEINQELETYLPQLKEQNDALKARIAEVEKDNASIKAEMEAVKKDKDETAVRKELERVKKENKELREEVGRLSKKKDHVESALKDQHSMVADEVNRMRLENEALSAKISEIKKTNEELEVRSAKLEDINNMLRQALGEKVNQGKQ